MSPLLYADGKEVALTRGAIADGCGPSDVVVVVPFEGIKVDAAFLARDVTVIHRAAMTNAAFARIACCAATGLAANMDTDAMTVNRRMPRGGGAAAGID